MWDVWQRGRRNVHTRTISFTFTSPSTRVNRPCPSHSHTRTHTHIQLSVLSSHTHHLIYPHLRSFSVFLIRCLNRQCCQKTDSVLIYCVWLWSVRESNTISIWNNGKGIPVVEHKDEKMYVPALIFGHLLTSSNYDDEEKKVTGNHSG